MKLILMGSPQFVVPIFDKIASRHEIVAVFTRAPKPVGRKQILTKTPVHIWAENKNIPVHTSIKDFQTLGPVLKTVDYTVVASYGVILKDDVLNAAPCINIHPSLLPKYRGPSPITSAIMNGDTESGVCLMQVAPEVDSGDIFMCNGFSIGENETTLDIENKVSEIASDMVLRFLESPEKYPAKPQMGTPTFTEKVTDNKIDWAKTPQQNHNQIRAIGGWTTINGIITKVLETRIENGELKITKLQPSGKKPMTWKEFINGQHGKCDIK